MFHSKTRSSEQVATQPFTKLADSDPQHALAMELLDRVTACNTENPDELRAATELLAQLERLYTEPPDPSIARGGKVALKVSSAWKIAELSLPGRAISIGLDPEGERLVTATRKSGEDYVLHMRSCNPARDPQQSFICNLVAPTSGSQLELVKIKF